MCRQCDENRAAENGQRTFGPIVGMEPVVTPEPNRIICAACGKETKGINSATGTDGADYCKDCFDDNYVTCTGCGDAVDREEEKTSDSGDDYCESCYDDTFTTCEGCSCEVDRGDSTRSDSGNDYCEDCYNETFTHCEHCNSECYSDDAHFVNDCEYICESCYDANYSRCNGYRCGETVCNDDAHSVDGDYYCQSCYDNNFSECACCGESVHNDDCIFREHLDESYCSSCDPGECECEDDCECEAPRPGYRRNRNSPHNPPGQRNRCYWSDAQFETSDRIAITRTSRTFAIEVETASCAGHKDFDGKYAFNCTSDGSISGEEFPSAVLSGDAGLEAITAFLDAANSAKWTVNSDCGTHAHFGVGDLSVDQLKSVAYAYLLTSDAWTSFVSKSRKANYYCQAIKWALADIAAIETHDDFIAFARRQGDSCRYQWINWGAYVKRGNNGGYRKTVECRLHAGSLDPVKMNNWINCHLRFIEHVSKMTLAQVERAFAGKSGYEQFKALAAIWDDKALADYMSARAAKFGTNYTTSTRRSTPRFVKV